MTVRNTLSGLILRMRSYGEAAEGEASVNGVKYWTDLQLQELLDDNRTLAWDVPLVTVSYAAGKDASGTITRKYFYTIPDSVSPWIEEKESPDSILVDSSGIIVDTGNFTLHGKEVRITGGNTPPTLYLRANTFNLYAAVSDLWLVKSSHRAFLINLKGGGYTLQEDQHWQHCISMHKYFNQRSGIKVARIVRGDHAPYRL